MKRLLIISILVCLSTGAYPWGSDKPATTADMHQKRLTKMAMREANKKIGMPAITNFQEKKLMKMIFELRDKEDLICHAYIVAQHTGKLVYLGVCLGYGIPYSVQYTNPMTVWDLEQDGGARNKYNDAGEIQVIPQPDPNGLFMPDGLSATWLIMFDPATKKTRPVYVEPEIIVSPFKLH